VGTNNIRTTNRRKNCFTVRVTELNRLPRGAGASCSGEIPRPAWTPSCVTYRRERALAEGWTRSPEVPSNPYSSVIL